MANTKLEKWQKEDLLEMHIAAKNDGIQVVNLDNVTTMAYKLKGNTVEFSLSVKSPDEKKFRRKVGEFFALARFFNMQTVRMATDDFKDMCETVWDVYLIP